MATASQQSENSTAIESADVDVVVIGAGFAGLYLIYRLREMGFSVQGIERAGGVGGTWYYNRYPGCRCDSESHVYCYSFSDYLLNEWGYSERYPEQEEILEYLNFAADHLEVRDDIRFETEVESAAFDEESGTWEISTDTDFHVSSQHLILAVGPLSQPYIPEFDGIDDFEGELYVTARWPHEPVNFREKDVAVVGTGSSGVQTIPRVADEADQLTVYQRTPNYVVPARNRPLDEDERGRIQENYDEIWETARNTNSGHPFESRLNNVEEHSEEEITEALEERWQQGGFRFFLTFENLLTHRPTNERVCEFIRDKIRERLDDPELAEKLTPNDHPYGAKRPPLDYENYYETYEEDHVSLVDVREHPIEKFTQTGIQTADSHRDHDAVILATGFDAVTGSFTNLDIQGRNQTALNEKWSGRPRSYLGVSVDQFPNLHLISGPQSPSAITNQPVSIEQQVEWVTDCIDYLRQNDFTHIEAKEESIEKWVEHSNAIAEKTVYNDADSWYVGENIPGKARVMLPYPGGFNNHRDHCDDIAANGYEGFELAESIQDLDHVPASSSVQL